MKFTVKLPLLTSMVALTSSACIIVEGGTSRPDDDFAWYDDDAGVGGSGASSGATSGAGGTGGSAPACIDELGTGETVDVCEDLSALSCGGEPSLAYASCVHGFDIYNPGPAEAFAACLQDIPAFESCEVDPVATCVERMYDDTCVSDFNADACAEWTNDCALHGESLDYELCAFELNPYSFEAMVDLLDCMNATDGLCQERYDTCFMASLTIE